MFDEFMEELRRRQAGELPEDEGSRPPRKGSDDDGPDDDGPDGGDEPRAEDSDQRDDLRDRRERADRDRASGGGRGAPPPRRRRRDSDGPSLRRQAGTTVAVLLGVFVILMAVIGIDLWTDAIWYTSVGYDEVFWRRIGVQVGLFVAGGLVVLLVLLANLWLAGRLLPPADGDGGTFRIWVDRLNDAAERSQGRGAPPWEQMNRRPRERVVNVTPAEIPDPTPLGRGIIAVLSVFVALTIAGSIAANWETILLWMNRVTFDPSGPAAAVDPVFGKDIGFFLFDLGFLRFLQATAIALVIASLVVAGARYVVGGFAGSPVFSTQVRVHLGVLAGLVLMLMAVGYQLDKFELTYSTRGVATGVSYTDANAQFLAYDVLTGLSAIAAALLVGGAFTRVMWPLALTVAVWFIASIAIGRVYPELVQRISVQPNEQQLEARYIANNIQMTRLGFDIDGWDVRDYRGEAPLTEAAITEHASTFLNARLWDYRPLGNTLDQLQTVRQYYDFADVDTDRYTMGEDVRQVMVSVREFNTAKNPNPTWTNDHLFYTHGIGVAMVPVNEVTQQGQPRLVIRDMPPVSSSGAPDITQPRVYYGELTSQYVVVGSKVAEFDYPRGGSEEAGNVTTSWTGTTGIKLDTVLSRLLFALRFRDFNLLISDQITTDSQLLFHRALADRLPRIAPFLLYDKDPYVVVDGSGGLVYVQDAYTASDRFPNAQAFSPGDLGVTGLGSSPFNYLRNSVKIVVNAYDGTMTFYVNDPEDPLIRAWQGVFPTLFRPMSEFPTDLRPHLRVPEELFNVQTRMYGRYHVSDPVTFYGQDDLWTVPIGQTTDNSLPSEAYYVIMSLPEENSPEFLLLQPMIPRERPNMIAWVAVRMDGDAYGQTLVYRFPAETNVFGPAQIEAQISADPVISSQFTLWSQAGSTVIRGNLIVVPVGDSLIYLQPVYLQATSAKFPAFQKIIVSSPTTVVWGDTLREALDSLLREQGSAGPSPSPTPGGSPGPTATPGPTGTPGAGPTPPAGDVAALIEFANAHFELAQQALRDGDFARYGEEIALVQQALQQLEELTGGAPASSVAPNPSTSPPPAP
ncbi:MAG TPA: UPF0182 family protein [Candidatus Limnocylindrales bacterium]|nr:UPF0182 family protein [Candidatus Limnocylindrales bacterium]